MEVFVIVYVCLCPKPRLNDIFSNRALLCLIVFKRFARENNPNMLIFGI